MCAVKKIWMKKWKTAVLIFIRRVAGFTLKQKQHWALKKDDYQYQYATLGIKANPTPERSPTLKLVTLGPIAVVLKFNGDGEVEVALSRDFSKVIINLKPVSVDLSDVEPHLNYSYSSASFGDQEPSKGWDKKAPYQYLTVWTSHNWFTSLGCLKNASPKKLRGPSSTLHQPRAALWRAPWISWKV